MRRREMLRLAGTVAGTAALGMAAYVAEEKLYRSTTTGNGRPHEQIQTSPGTSKAIHTGGSAINSRPNDGTGYWPDSSNTGYIHAPGYTGSLTVGPTTITTGSTYSHMSFHGCDVGLPDARVDNIQHSSAACSGESVPAVPGQVQRQQHHLPVLLIHADGGWCPFHATYDESYQYAVLFDGGAHGTAVGMLTMTWCDVWGYGNGLQLDGSSHAAPHSIINCWFHHAADTDAARGGSTGTYHVDAILCTVGGANETYLLIRGNSLASLGNTNAIALQRDGRSYYNHVTVTNNYLAGFGHTVQIGGDGNGNSHITFTGNTWSTEIGATFGPLYGWEPITRGGRIDGRSSQVIRPIL